MFIAFALRSTSPHAQFSLHFGTYATDTIDRAVGMLACAHALALAVFRISLSLPKASYASARQHLLHRAPQRPDPHRPPPKKPPPP